MSYIRMLQDLFHTRFQMNSKPITINFRIPPLAPTVDERVEGGAYGDRAVKSDIEEDFSNFEVRTYAAEMIGNERTSVLCRERQLAEAIYREQTALKEIIRLQEHLKSLTAELQTIRIERSRQQGRLNRLEEVHWKRVTSNEVFYELKHGKFADILKLLGDGEISTSKAAEAIVERANGVE